MSYWICCNSCFLPPSADRNLAVTSCRHVICSSCSQTGTQGKCLICKAECKVSPLSNKSSSEVKAFFSDISAVANEHFTEVTKIVMFQASHRKRLLTHYKEKNEKLEEVLGKMKQEMQKMTKKLNEQSDYISKLENCLQHQSVKAPSVSQMNSSHQTTHGHKSVLPISNKAMMSLSRHSSATNVTENMEVDEKSLFRKPNMVRKVSLVNPAKDERIGNVPHRSLIQRTLAKHTAHLATVSHFQSAPVTPDGSSGRGSGCKSPIFKPPTSFRHSMPSLVGPPSKQTHTHK